MPFDLSSSKLETLGPFSVYHSLSSCILTLQPFWVPPFVVTVHLFMLPCTSLVWHVSFPTLALSRLLFTATVNSHCAFPAYGTRFPTLWRIQSNHKSHGLGHNSQDSEASESVFLCSHSSATLSSPAKLSDTLLQSCQAAPLCCESHIWRGRRHLLTLSDSKYPSYPQTNITTICHIPETQVFI